MMKQFVWMAVIVAVLGGLAYPKLKPLWAADDKVQTKTAGKEGSNKEASKGAGKKGEGKNAPPLKVSTFVVTPADFAETIASTGTLRADEGVELQAETNGKVVSINFNEGSPVKKGALLIKLNDSDLRANLDRYRYTKQLAELREQRLAQLVKQKVVTQEEYDAALNEVRVQQANIELYQAQIEKTEMRAPFDGVVGLRYVSLGAFVNAQTKIATLQRLDKLKVDFAVPEKYSGRAKVGTEITISVAGGEKKFKGVVYAIDPRIDSGTRTLLLRAICPNNEGSLLPGAFANVVLPLEKLPNALLVPAEAVVPGLEEKNVFVIKNGMAERRAVETGSRTASQVHIISGLKPGDVLITSGLQQMRAGQAVAALDEHSDKRHAGDKGVPNDKTSDKSLPGQAHDPTKSDTSGIHTSTAKLAGA